MFSAVFSFAVAFFEILFTDDFRAFWVVAFLRIDIVSVKKIVRCSCAETRNETHKDKRNM